MKNSLLSVLAAMILLSICVSCSNSKDVKISVTDSDDTYEFFAKFDRKKSRPIQDYINAKIAPSSIYTDDDVEITTTLDDKTQFELEESPGKVRIKLDKEDNSVASYHRVKNMCEGIKKIISQK